MKIRKCLILSVALAFCSQLFAQVDFISVEKLADHNQTGADVTSPRPLILGGEGQPPISAPYQFRIDVEGDGISGLTPPTFTIPAGSNYDGTYGLNYSAEKEEWGRIYYFGTKYNATGGPGDGPRGLDGIFNNGAYSVTIGATTVDLTLGGDANADLYPNVPVATLSAGTWAGGGSNILYLNVNEALTITTNQFTNFYTNGYLNHIGFFIGRSDIDIADLQRFSDDTLFPGANTDDFASYTINAGTLISGQTYYVEMEFVVVADISHQYTDALGVALFTSRTQFVIYAVPEPSTYAAILGALALAGVVVMRRRRT